VLDPDPGELFPMRIQNTGINPYLHLNLGTGWKWQSMLQLAKQKEFTPQKYFSIDRVFRNETLDATHLAEFHQIEGLLTVWVIFYERYQH
jgi:O-phosphoseryl-tRNA(Cys) synthetase